MQIVEHLDQREKTDAKAAARCQMHSAAVVGNESARYPDVLGLLGRGERPQV